MRTPHSTHGADELNSHPPAIATEGAYQSTSLPVYQSTSLPVYQSTSLPVYQSTDELSECNAGTKLIVLRNCNGPNDWSITF